jgi:hypothetical protein
VEPFPGVEPGCASIPRTRGRRSEGRELAELDSKPALLDYEDMEPPPGADPGHPPYEGRAAAVRGGEAAHRGFEPRLPDSESSVLPIERMGIECGRRESNAYRARGGIRTRT